MLDDNSPLPCVTIGHLQSFLFLLRLLHFLLLLLRLSHFGLFLLRQLGLRRLIWNRVSRVCIRHSPSRAPSYSCELRSDALGRLFLACTSFLGSHLGEEENQRKASRSLPRRRRFYAVARSSSSSRWAL